MKTKQILLTGGSGTVGGEILNILCKRSEYSITVFDIYNKKTKSLLKKYGANINFIAGDITNESEIKNISSGFDVVIHLAALIPPLADEYPALTRKVNVEGTRSLINHIQETSPEAFFIYSSSISVYGDRLKTPYIRVTDPLKTSNGDVYGQSKLDAEVIVRNSSLKWTVFRLAAIMKNHRISKLMFHMPLDTQFEICTAEDTARAFVNAIDNKDILSGQVFNLGGGEKCCISYNEFLKKSFNIYGLGKLNFPEHAFAEQNFHCGRLIDGDELENLLHFRKDTFDSYFEKTKKSITAFQRFIIWLWHPFIKWILLLQSEPYQAYRRKDEKLLNHFFRVSNV